jgi:hypothetical protein
MNSHDIPTIKSRFFIVKSTPKIHKNPRRLLTQVVSTAITAPDGQRFIPSPTPQVAFSLMHVTWLSADTRSGTIQPIGKSPRKYEDNMGIIWDTVAIYWNIFLQQMETERKIPKKILVG